MRPDVPQGDWPQAKRQMHQALLHLKRRASDLAILRHGRNPVRFVVVVAVVQNPAAFACRKLSGQPIFDRNVRLADEHRDKRRGDRANRCMPQQSQRII